MKPRACEGQSWGQGACSPGTEGLSQSKVGQGQGAGGELSQDKGPLLKSPFAL